MMGQRDSPFSTSGLQQGSAPVRFGEVRQPGTAAPREPWRRTACHVAECTATRSSNSSASKWRAVV
jgi:hypothetical protein